MQSCVMVAHKVGTHRTHKSLHKFGSSDLDFGIKAKRDADFFLGCQAGQAKTGQTRKGGILISTDLLAKYFFAV